MEGDSGVDLPAEAVSVGAVSVGPVVEAFEAIFRAHYDDVVRYAIRRVGLDSAHDVAADVFLVAWRRSSEVQDVDRNWLLGVAAKVIANQQRGERRRERLIGRLASDPTDAGDEHSRCADDQSRIRAAVDGLPDAEREAVMLVMWDGLSVSDAALVAGCSTGALRVRLHRARRRLSPTIFKRPADGSET